MGSNLLFEFLIFQSKWEETAAILSIIFHLPIETFSNTEVICAVRQSLALKHNI